MLSYIEEEEDNKGSSIDIREEFKSLYLFTSRIAILHLVWSTALITSIRSGT
jgi:hypothetical protein